jgi:hypothetical protein
MDPSNNEGNANTRKKRAEKRAEERKAKLHEAENWSLIAYLFRLIAAKEAADREGVPLDPALAAELKKGMAWADRQTRRVLNPAIPPMTKEYEKLLRKNSPTEADRERIKDTEGVVAAFAEELGAGLPLPVPAPGNNGPRAPPPGLPIEFVPVPGPPSGYKISAKKGTKRKRRSSRGSNSNSNNNSNSNSNNNNNKGHQSKRRPVSKRGPTRNVKPASKLDL